MSEGNGSMEALHRINRAEERQRTLEDAVRAIELGLADLCGKVDHLATLINANGQALEWLIKEKKMRRRKKAA